MITLVYIAKVEFYDEEFPYFYQLKNTFIENPKILKFHNWLLSIDFSNNGSKIPSLLWWIKRLM